MKNNSDFLKFAFLGLCSLFIVQSLYFLPPSKFSYAVNDLPYWYTYSSVKRSAKPLPLVGVSIDDYSLNSSTQRWPWKRSAYAELIKVLDKEKAAVIGLDFVLVGESEDPADDLALKEAISSASSRVVLAYLFDSRKGEPVFPLGQLKESAYALGMLNTPLDRDETTRRLRGFIESQGNTYYSFSVELAAAYLGRSPRELAASLPLLRDKTFLVDFMLKPKDARVVSFYDVLYNLEKLKQAHGDDFLKGALVIVYPGAEIQHDVYATPLGKMPGGFLHFNGVANILSGNFLQEKKILLAPFLIFSAAAILFILLFTGFLSGLLLAAGVLLLDFWGLVWLSIHGLRFDYFYLLSFICLFFVLGSLYKYLYFFIQILKIKDKATLDPLRSLYTLRYFYYRLALEMKKAYFGRERFLVFIYLEGLKAVTEEVSLEKTRDIWKGLSSVLPARRVFWAVYSPDEIAGCLVEAGGAAEKSLQSLRGALNSALLRMNISVDPKITCVKFNKKYPVVELLSILSKETRPAKEEVRLLKDDYAAKLVEPYLSPLPVTDKFLEGIDRDIEDKNAQLLSLLESLNKEHAKSKEAFFQIITSLVNALEARDPYTNGHSERVSRYSLMLADKLGWDKEAQEKLKKAAQLHDLGKIGIPDSILHKKGGLTDEEFDFIRKHEIIGVKILEPLKEFAEILPWILYHHERWDGKGYPHGLAGAAIPEAAQIISLADVFDALSTGRDYKAAFSVEDSLKEIAKNKGLQFNPRLADIFLEIISGLHPKT